MLLSPVLSSSYILRPISEVTVNRYTAVILCLRLSPVEIDFIPTYLSRQKANLLSTPAISQSLDHALASTESGWGDGQRAFPNKASLQRLESCYFFRGSDTHTRYVKQRRLWCIVYQNGAPIKNINK